MKDNFCPACGELIQEKGYGDTYCCSRDCHQFMIDQFLKEWEDEMTKTTKEFFKDEENV